MARFPWKVEQRLQRGNVIWPESGHRGGCRLLPGRELNLHVMLAERESLELASNHFQLSPRISSFQRRIWEICANRLQHVTMKSELKTWVGTKKWAGELATG
jgi:hypothetical protein